MTNFIVESIAIEGFRSFREPQTFLVNRPPGLYFIGGKNFVEAIGANGSGKSSIWDALVWCFFGKSLLGVKGGNVKNWDDTKVCKVTVTLLKDDTKHVITRTQGPNSLTLNGETVVQRDIHEFLHLDWEKFIFSLIVGQFNATFLDLQPTEKLNLFSSVMGLGFWESCSKEATARHAELHKRAQSVAVEIGAIQARLTALEASRASLEAFSSTFEGSRASQIMDLDRAATETMALIEQADIDRRLMQAKRHTQDTAIHALEFDVERLTANITDIEGQWKSFADTIIADRATIATLTQDFNKWRD